MSENISENDIDTNESLLTDQSSSNSGHGSVDSKKGESEESRRNRRNTRETEENNANKRSRDRKLSVTISEDGSKSSWRNEYALSRWVLTVIRGHIKPNIFSALSSMIG